jgi:Uma2 family endonuclease
MATIARESTADDLWLVSQDHPDSQYELLEGTIIEVTPSSASSSLVAAEILFLIRSHVRTTDSGHIVGADGGFTLAPNTVFSPDVGYISKERQPDVPERFFPIAPDLAVEVVSPTDSIKATHRKALLYLRYGTQLVWVVYPDDKVVDVYRPADDNKAIVETIEMNGTLDGGTVLLDLKISIREIFKVLGDR